MIYFKWSKNISIPLQIPSEKAMASHSSTLAWKIPRTEEPGRLQSMRSLRVRLSNFTFTFHFHALEKEMATYSSVLAWRIPGTGEPGGLPSIGLHRVGHDWSDLAAAAANPLGLPKWFSSKESACNAENPGSIPGVGRSSREGSGNLVQYSYLGNPMDRGAWQATVPGVTKSWIWLRSWAHTRAHKPLKRHGIRFIKCLHLQCILSEIKECNVKN